MTNRIDACFAALRAKSQKAFVAYITAGDPTLDTTVDLVLALEQAGVDVVELGVPFSDPLADGVVNQLAAQRALEGGASVAGVLRTIEKIRQKSTIPLVLFTYLNPLYRYGFDRFAVEAKQAGSDGLLLLDLPPEETLLSTAQAAQSLHRISLIAPTTPAVRVATLAQAARGFIYYVSRAGVTGVQQEVALGIAEQVAAIRAHSSVPICVGFGISNAQQASQVAQLADGVVVGSALVSQIGQWGKEPDAAQRLEKLARPFAEAIHAA